MNTIRTRMIRVGNSCVLRIPRAFIEQLGLCGEVEITIQGNRLVLQSASHCRSMWDEVFCKMAAEGDDALLDAPQTTEWDATEWDW